MPVDPMMLGPMLDTFKNMANDCTAQGHSGPAYDRMMTALGRMESLGQEMDDFMAYSAKISAEGLQMEFSTAYGEVLAGAAQSQSENSENGGYDDAALLKQNVDALKRSIQAIKDGVVQAENEAKKHLNSEKDQAVALNEIEKLAHESALIKPIEDLIKLGESGINFPTFLRLQIEKGLDKAMDGQGVVRDALDYELSFAKASALSPHSIQQITSIIEAFDDLAKRAPFGIPDSFEFELIRQKTDHQYVPLIQHWSDIQREWSRIFSLLDTWAIAHCSFAPFIEPWSMSRDPKAAVIQDKETLPGIIRQRIRLLEVHYGIKFENILDEETFFWDVKNHHFPYSQVYTTLLINEILPICQPHQLLDQSIIDQVEQLHKGHKMANPENHKVLERQQQAYDAYFGKGLFEQKFGQTPDFGERNASPWTL